MLQRIRSMINRRSNLKICYIRVKFWEYKILDGGVKWKYKFKQKFVFNRDIFNWMKLDVQLQ